MIHNALRSYLRKPELGATDTSSLYHALWDDDHISKGMLEAHLNPDWDAASRKHAFLDESAHWIAGLAPPSQHPRLLDLGCGPGLYAERFAQAGYVVTGIDYSKRSIDYAKKQTARIGSGIEYHYQNYLTLNYSQQFDVVCLIYCDYAPLPFSDRMALLNNVYQALTPGGKFILDVFTPKMRQKESHTWRHNENGGFFCEKPHLLLEAVYQYDDDDKTELSQSIVITDDDVRCYICPNHYFTKASLMSEFQHYGFKALDFFGDVTGKEYSDAGDTICCVLTK